MRPDLHSSGVAYPSRKLMTCLPPMMGFVMAFILEPFNLTRRMDGIASSIVSIFIHNQVDQAMVGLDGATHVTISRPGNS